MNDSMARSPHCIGARTFGWMVLGSIALVGFSTPVLAQGRDLLIQADRIQLAPDRVLENGSILVRAGKVALIGDDIPESTRSSARKATFKGTLVAGFVNAHSYLGQAEHLRENIDAFTPELLASDAFDPFGDNVLAAARTGVTAVGLAPQSLNVFAGQAAAVRTGKLGSILVEASYLKMALVRPAFDQNRFPTSRMGAADLIRGAFKRAADPLAANDPQLDIIKQVATGRRRVVVHANTQGEIGLALDLAQELNLRLTILGAAEADKCLARLTTQKVTLILGSLGFGSKKHELELPAELERRGLPFAFAAERPLDLRLSAALAVRHGCSRKVALAAITTEAAELLDAKAHIGSLYQGHYADMAVYSGDPLDLSSRLVAVFVAGEQINLTGKEKKK